MNSSKSKLIRKTVKRLTGDRFRELLTAMLDARLKTRLRYAVIIIFRLGYKDLKEGG
jgi:hypothetical protein